MGFMIPLAADILADGITALTSVYTFLSGNGAFSVMIGIAVAGIGASVFLGLFFRR